jgi:hypothetical protein
MEIDSAEMIIKIEEGYTDTDLLEILFFFF